MFKKLHNIFISFSIIFHKFRGWNPKYRGGNVKGVRWLHGLDEQSIEDKDYSWNIVGLNFEFLLVLNHDDMTWDCPKKEDMGNMNGFLDTQFGEVKIVVGNL